MATPIRPTTDELCLFTDPETADAGRAFSAPLTTDCAAPAGLTIGDDIETTYDDDGNPVFGEVPEEEEDEVSAGVDPAIDSVEDLAAIVTTTITIGSAAAIKMWIDDGTDTFQVWQLETGTDAHDPLGGVVRPDDYNAVTNQKVWRKKN